MAEEIKKTEEPKAEDLIEKANAAAARLEAANKRAEELQSKAILAGRSEAGALPVAPPDPENEKKSRINRILKNSGVSLQI